MLDALPMMILLTVSAGFADPADCPRSLDTCVDQGLKHVIRDVPHLDRCGDDCPLPEALKERIVLSRARWGDSLVVDIESRRSMRGHECLLEVERLAFPMRGDAASRRISEPRFVSHASDMSACGKLDYPQAFIPYAAVGSGLPADVHRAILAVSGKPRRARDTEIATAKDLDAFAANPLALIKSIESRAFSHAKASVAERFMVVYVGNLLLEIDLNERGSLVDYRFSYAVH